jgi:hypothetical protein
MPAEKADAKAIFLEALECQGDDELLRFLEQACGAEGRPYFVMDLVKGVPLTKYCDEHRLTPMERLELFIPVCQAIQHAAPLARRRLFPVFSTTPHGSGRRRALYCGRPPVLNKAEPAMSDVTRILSAIEQGDPHAAEQAAWPAGQRRKLKNLPLF